MKNCAKCKKEFKSWVRVDGRVHNLKNRKFCLECSPFKKHNTKDLTLINVIPKLSSYQHVKKFRHNKKEKAIAYKGGKCVVCGYVRCQRNLAFHHLDPTNKDFNISTKSAWGFERLKKELDKCILVCHNCHGEIHAGLVDLAGFEPATQRLSSANSTAELQIKKL